MKPPYRLTESLGAPVSSQTMVGSKCKYKYLMIFTIMCPPLSVIIEALLLGVQDGQDILTLSLGGSDGWTESSSSTVASRIAASGKIVTIAAGGSTVPMIALCSHQKSSVANIVMARQRWRIRLVVHIKSWKWY